MAKQRPTLPVQAQPVNTFISPGNIPLAGVELYDQQTVNLALQFADAFKDFSLTASKLAGSLKQEANEEALKEGMDLVNRSQKSYRQLVDAGEIKPSENPWQAIGAQQASGTMEGLNARAHFMSLYNKRVQEDPAFLDGPEGFSALAAQYAENVNSQIGNAPYLSRSFYESFNPFIASMGLTHEENVQKERQRKVTLGVSAAAVQALQDLNSPDEKVRSTAMAGLQETVDGYVRSGYNPSEINQTVAKAMIDAMVDSDDSLQIENAFNTVKAGTGLLKDTQFAKVYMASKMPEIQARRSRMTVEESKTFETVMQDTITNVLSGSTSAEAAEQYIRDVASGQTAVNGKFITLSAQEMEVKVGYYLSSLSRAQKEAAARIEQQQEDFMFSRIREESVTVLPEETTLSPLQQKALKSDRLETDMARLNLSEKQKAQYRDRFNSAWKEETENRELYAVEASTNAVWEGTGVNPGLTSVINSQITSFIMSPTATAPNFLAAKERLDNLWETTYGISPDSEKARALSQNAYGKFDALIEQQERAIANSFDSKSLIPLSTDSPEIRESKAGVRQKIRYMRMALGGIFDDGREVSRGALTFQQALNPQTLENAQMAAEVEDWIMSYALVRRNNLPVEYAVPNPNSTNGKFMLKELDWAYQQIVAGVNPMDIAKDMSQRRIMGASMGADPYNPLGWVEFDTGSGKDTEAFNQGLIDFRSNMEITETDATLYVAKVFWDATHKSLATTAIGNMKKAMDEANAAVLQNNIIVRGSLIPRTKLNPSIDAAYVEAWLDSKGYPAGTTLVPVAPNNDGTYMLAPRLNGQSVANSVLIRSTELNSVGPEIIKKFGENLKTNRRFKASDIQEARLDMIRKPKY